MTSKKLAFALAGLLAVSGTGVYAATNDTTTTEESPSTASSCERGHGFGDREAQMTALIEALGLTEADVEAARENGQSLPELAEAEGITIDAFIAALLSSHEVKLDAAVESGELTQEEADAMLEEHKTRFADVTSYDDLEDVRGPGHGHRGGHGPHHGNEPDADDAPADDNEVKNQSTNAL